MAEQIIQLVHADPPSANDFIGDVAIYCPRILAYQKYYSEKLDFGPGHLSGIGQIVIDYLLKEDVTRILNPDLLVTVDAALSQFFDAAKGKLIIFTWSLHLSYSFTNILTLFISFRDIFCKSAEWSQCAWPTLRQL